jgi:hypothetical protein
MMGRFTGSVGTAVGGGVEGGSSCTEPRRDGGSPRRAVFTDGDGVVAVSEDMVGGAGEALLRARYER